MQHTAEQAPGGRPARNRLIALAVAAVCAAPLVTAAVLVPSSAGTGTHTQLGLPPCGFKAMTGLPCATCGCTTSFSHAANGSILASFLNQPFGAAFALALAMMVLVGLWGVWTGVSLAPLGRVLSSRRHVLAWVAVLLLGWGYKIAVVLGGQA